MEIQAYTHPIRNANFIPIFSSHVIFTMAIGSFLEITDFLSDQFLGTRMQPGPGDTMYDLIFDLAGGIITGVLGDVCLKRMPKNGSLGISRMEKEFYGFVIK